MIDELVATSQCQRSEPAKHTHGWLDNNGKNSWELWTTYIQDRDNVIWKASLNVATATDGKRYLYDIPKIKKVEQPGERRAHLPPTATVAQQGQNVNQKHSRELETIEELKQQNELLKKQVDCWLIKMMKVSLAAINKWGAVQIGETPLAALRNVRFSITLFIALSFPKQVKKAGEKREKTMNRGKLKFLENKFFQGISV